MAASLISVAVPTKPSAKRRPKNYVFFKEMQNIWQRRGWDAMVILKSISILYTLSSFTLGKPFNLMKRRYQQSCSKLSMEHAKSPNPISHWSNNSRRRTSQNKTVPWLPKFLTQSTSFANNHPSKLIFAPIGKVVFWSVFYHHQMWKIRTPLSDSWKAYHMMLRKTKAWKICWIISSRI